MKQSKKGKQRGPSTTPEVHFSVVQIPSPLAVLLRCVQSDDGPLGPKHVVINTINKTKKFISKKQNNII